VDRRTRPATANQTATRATILTVRLVTGNAGPTARMVAGRVGQGAPGFHVPRAAEPRTSGPGFSVVSKG